MTLPAIVAIDAVAWCAAQVGAGYAVHRLDDDWLDSDCWLLRPRSFEVDGRFYRTTLRVHRWKRFLPEGGTVFGDFDKRALRGWAPTDLNRYQRETRRAELAHWLAIGALPLFVLWNPPMLWPAMALYAAAVNVPCIASQRYNRLRISRVLARRASGSRSSAAARRRRSAGTSGSSIP